MEGMNLADAKARLSELVDRVEEGQSIDILRRGKLAARLSPPVQPKSRIDAKRLAALTKRLPRQPQSAAAEIRAMRDAERY